MRSCGPRGRERATRRAAALEAAQKAAAEAGLEDWARANRASSAAANQQNEADERYKQASAAVDADVSDAMADALRPLRRKPKPRRVRSTNG